MPALVGSGLFHTCFDTPYNELVHTFHLARDSTSEPSRSESSLFFPDMSGAPDKRSRSMAGVTANSIYFVSILLLSGLATNSIFFCFLFVKNHWLAWRPNQWPLIWETLFSFVPLRNILVSVSDPWRAFWDDTAPFKGPRLASSLASRTTEIQGHSQVCRARRESPRTPSTTTDANLDCAFVENALFYTDPWFWKVNRIKLS